MKPSIVLGLICIIVSGLLILTYNATYVDTTGVITDSISDGLKEVFGNSEGFEMVKESKNGEEDLLKLGNENSIMVNPDGNVAIEVTADGYAKGGLTAVVGFVDGKVKGVSIISISETPGLGTKVDDKGFLSQFIGLENNEYKLDTVTGATYSSKGMKNLVDTAIETYNSYQNWKTDNQ
jgi:electron transport complex protein RnfG